jgi:tetratricopeptide (TPR) repeat protein
MFFPKLRRQAKWMFVFLALVFGLGFVLFGVGSGSGGLSDLLQGNFDLLGSGSTAEKDADKARDRIKKNPNDAQAYRDLATALQTQSKPDEAIAALEQYRTLRPKDTEALSELGALYLREAEEARTRANAIQIEAGASTASSLFAPDPSSKLGQALSASSDPLAGYDPINRAVQADVTQRSSSAYSAMSGAYTKAVSVFEDVAQANPTDPNAWSQLAQTAEAANNTQLAITAYEKFLELAPDDPLAPAIRDRVKQLRSSQPGANAGG